MNTAPLVDRGGGVLHARAVARDQRAQIAMVVAPVLGDELVEPQPHTPLAARAGVFQQL
jgi:hypothetical protein